MRTSIVITSYNYDRYVRAAIDGALAQSHPATQVVVVDDGSTDGSPEVVRSYADRAVVVCKTNGGQASAFNAGLAACDGQLVCFMDSDDLIYPHTMARAVAAVGPGHAKVHWPLDIIDADGRATGDVMHRHDLAAGDVRPAVLAGGPAAYNWPCTSGNAWTRTFLDRVMPMPEAEYRIGPDVYLAALAPLFGEVARLDAPGGAYRIHGHNNTFKEPFDARVASAVRFWDHCFGVLASWCDRLGLKCRPADFAAHSFWHRTATAAREIEARVPPGSTIVLAGEEQWVTDEIGGRRVVPMLQRGGQYWGPPADDGQAIEELDRDRAAGATHLVVPWWATWWREHYDGFWRHLLERHELVFENDRLTLFRLIPSPAGRAHA
ncbi:MAG: glycosyltransferase family 2 protein [Phycisphaerae bacterium]